MPRSSPFSALSPQTALIHTDHSTESIKREDIQALWVRMVPGGAAGLKKTQALIRHAKLGEFQLEIGLPMSPDAVRGWVASSFQGKAFRAAVKAGEWKTGLAETQPAIVAFPHRYPVRLVGKPSWDLQTARPSQKLFRLVSSLKAVPAPKKGLWEGDPLAGKELV